MYLVKIGLSVVVVHEDTYRAKINVEKKMNVAVFSLINKFYSVCIPRFEMHWEQQFIVPLIVVHWFTVFKVFTELIFQHMKREWK